MLGHDMAKGVSLEESQLCLAAGSRGAEPQACPLQDGQHWLLCRRD